MVDEQPTVYLVDDDPDMRKLVQALLSSVEIQVCSFASAAEFLDGYDADALGCLLLDVRLPGMSGLDLQDELRARGVEFPVIIVTGYGDVSMAVRAMKNGALDFIEKPFKGQTLIDRIQEAIRFSAEARAARKNRKELQAQLAQLTPRERQVVDMIVGGMSSKQIAAEFRVTTQAVDAHRARAMRKLNTKSVATLAKLVLLAECPDWKKADFSEGNMHVA